MDNKIYYIIFAILVVAVIAVMISIAPRSRIGSTSAISTPTTTVMQSSGSTSTGGTTSTITGTAPCPNGTVASYANTACTQEYVTYVWPQNTYSFNSTGIPYIQPSDVDIKLDPYGPFTLLISSPYWNLTKPNEQFNLSLRFQVSGINETGGWQHGCTATGTGKIVQTTVIESNPVVISRSYCNATSITFPNLTYVPFPLGTYNVIVNISASSGNGTATLRSYGTHFKVGNPGIGHI